MFRKMSRETLDHLVDALMPMAVPKVGVIGAMLLFGGQDTVRVFRPRIKVRLGCRMLDGDFGFFLRLPAQTLKDASRIPTPPSLTLSPMMNYPEIVGASAMENDRISAQMIRLISAQLDRIPTSAERLEMVFGSDFLEKSTVERCIALTRHLRSKT